MLIPPKRHVVLKVLTENKVFYFSKKALCAGTACNKGHTISPVKPLFWCILHSVLDNVLNTSLDLQIYGIYITRIFGTQSNIYDGASFAKTVHDF